MLKFSATRSIVMFSITLRESLMNRTVNPLILRTGALLLALFLVYTGVNAAEKVAKPSLQIPDSTWAAACRMLGRQTAAAAVALIYEKHEDGLIDNPGAYLNGMLSKAEAGQLHLPASLFHWRKPRKERRAPSTPTYRN